MIEAVDDRTVLVGTAHVSSLSVAQVEATIRERRPQEVHVELDERRLEALRDPDAWQATDIVKVLREKKQHLFLLQLYLANMQARIGAQEGVAPGSEMLRAMQVADEIGARVVLIDRDVSVTLKRGFARMGFFQRMKLFWNVWLEVLTPASKEQKPFDIDAMLETDAITAMTEEFSRFAPTVKVALIDERDAFMASHIQEAREAGRSVVAVVGAGHVPGIKAHLAAPRAIPDRAPLMAPPPPRLTALKVFAYLVPLAVLAGFGWMLYKGEFSVFLDNVLYWVIVNGTLSAVGVAVALGHPLSMLAAFAAAPITSLNPTLAAGWFAGLSEAKLRTPTVRDFQSIKTVDSWGQFYKNPVIRILLVTAFANLGSMIGTWLGLARIIRTVV